MVLCSWGRVELSLAGTKSLYHVHHAFLISLSSRIWPKTLFNESAPKKHPCIKWVATNKSSASKTWFPHSFQILGIFNHPIHSVLRIQILTLELSKHTINLANLTIISCSNILISCFFYNSWCEFWGKISQIFLQAMSLWVLAASPSQLPSFPHLAE